MIKGNVTGHYLAVKPDKTDTDEKVIGKGALKDFVIEAAPDDANKVDRMDAMATTGVVVSVGSMCWKAYDFDKPGWEPWAAVGDRIVFVRHSAKVIKDETDLDEFGKPNEIWVIADENVTWRIGKADE